MKTGLRLITNSVVRTIYFLLSVGIALAMTPIIVRSLGDRSYGLWAIIGTFMGFYGFFDVGITTAVARYVARANARKDTREANKVLTNALALFSGVAVIVLLLGGILILASGAFLANPSESDVFRKAAFILSVHVALSFPLRIFTGILKAMLRYDLFVYASSLRLLVGNTLILLTLNHGHGIVAMAASLFIAHALEYACYARFACRIFPQIRLRRDLIDRKVIRSLLSYSAKSAVIEIANLLRLRLDFLVIAKVMGLAAVTPYAVGARLIDYFGQLMGSVFGNLIPLFSQYEGTNDQEGMRRSVLTLINFNTTFAVFIGASIIFHGETFILWWMGPDFHASFEVVCILVIPTCISLMQIVGTNVLMGTSKHQTFAMVSLAGGILNVVLSVILAKRYGIYGVAMGTAVEVTLLRVFIVPALICRAIDLSLWTYYARYFVCTIRTLIPLLLIFWALNPYLQPAPARIVLLIGVQLTLWIPIFYFVALGKTERDIMRKAIERRTTPSRAPGQ
jgi:O-antigen/teichoic acid export membrane protein